jgi:hypothetical protein
MKSTQEKPTTDTLTNHAGGTYVVTSPFGWCQDSNPFRAFMKLAESAHVTGYFPNAKDRKSDGSIVKAADNRILVYYVKDASEFHGTSWYQPVDRNNNPIGILIYGGSNNVESVQNLVHKRD